MVSSNTNGMEEVWSHLLSVSTLGMVIASALKRQNFFQTHLKHVLAGNCFSTFFLIRFFFFLFVFYKLPFSSSETRTHDMDEKTKSFILISGKRGAGEGGRLWQNFLLVFGVKKFYLSLHGESIRKSAHVPSWWLSDFFFSSSSCFIRKQLLGGKNALLRTKRSKLSGKLQSSFDNAREKDFT